LTEADYKVGGQKAEDKNYFKEENKNNYVEANKISDTYELLKSYRLKTSREEGIKPYFIFNNAEMEELIKINPRTKTELLRVRGFGEKKIEKYGDAILNILNR